MLTLTTRLAIVLIFTIVFSCNTKDHEIQVVNCLYKGKNSLMVQKYYGSITKETVNEDFVYNEQGMPLKFISKRDNSHIDTVSNVVFSLSSDEQQFDFQYDAKGFLIKIVRSQAKNDEGNFIYQSHGPFKKGQTVTKQEIDYSYASDLLKTTVSTTTETFKAGSFGPLVTTISVKKDYKYEFDEKGKTSKMTCINDDGSKSVILYVNGIKSSQTYLDKDGNVGSTIIFNDKGRPVSNNSSNSKTLYQFDERGNLMLLENYYMAKPAIKYEMRYDDHPHFETAIPASFEGIKENGLLGISIFGAGINNVLYSKTTNFQATPNLIYEENASYTYNGKGFPATSTLKSNSNAISVLATTYKYESCQ